MASVYTINKGINKPIEFKGLKAQYIWYVGGGLVSLLIVFAVLYICGVHPVLLLVVTVALATALFRHAYRLSRVHGEHGLMKKLARRSVPVRIKANSRRLFIQKTFKRHD